METTDTLDITDTDLRTLAERALASGHAVTVTDHGKTLGQFIPEPSRPSLDKVRQAIEGLKALREKHPVPDLAALILEGKHR